MYSVRRLVALVVALLRLSRASLLASSPSGLQAPLAAISRGFVEPDPGVRSRGL